VSRIPWLALLIGMTTMQDAGACRCVQKNLAEYFEAADLVFFGQLAASSDQSQQRKLAFELTGIPHRGAALSGDDGSIRITTEKSTAACGIQPVVDAIYIVFARRNGEDFVTDSCSGTRIALAPGLSEPEGFIDVPARFVAQQLNALAGLDVLRAVSANQPIEEDPANGVLIGLLDLKPLAHGGHTLLFAGPDSSKGVLAVVDNYTEVESREVGYEVPAAIVYARRDGWYRLRLADGRYGWTPAEDAGTFFPYAELPLRRLAYLTGGWSGFVWPQAGAGLPFQPGRDTVGQEMPAEIVESARIGGSLWFRVELLQEDPCSSPSPPTDASGWIPAYGRDGSPNAWYYSRGC